MITVCPHCQMEYPETPDEYQGILLTCDGCQQNFVCEKARICPGCGTANAGKSFKCRQCGTVLVKRPPQRRPGPPPQIYPVPSAYPGKTEYSEGTRRFSSADSYSLREKIGIYGKMFFLLIINFVLWGNLLQAFMDGRLNKVVRTATVFSVFFLVFTMPTLVVYSKLPNSRYKIELSPFTKLSLIFMGGVGLLASFMMMISPIAFKLLFGISVGAKNAFYSLIGGAMLAFSIINDYKRITQRAAEDIGYEERGSQERGSQDDDIGSTCSHIMVWSSFIMPFLPLAFIEASVFFRVFAFAPALIYITTLVMTILTYRRYKNHPYFDRKKIVSRLYISAIGPAIILIGFIFRLILLNS